MVILEAGGFLSRAIEGRETLSVRCSLLEHHKPQILLIIANKVTLVSSNIVPQLNFELSRRMGHLSLQDPVVLPSPQSQNGILSMHHIKPPTLDTSRNYDAGYKKSDCSVLPLEYCSRRAPSKG